MKRILFSFLSTFCYLLIGTGPMLASPRCGARTRSGKPCRSPAVEDKRRCRLHSGAHGSGAPRGNKNALKHGLYTREASASRRQLRELMRQSRELLFKLMSARLHTQAQAHRLIQHPRWALLMPTIHGIGGSLMMVFSACA